MTRLTLALCLMASPALAADFSGIAKAVDGDTIRVGEQRVRLCGIQAAETNTAAGKEARRFMHVLVDGRQVTCKPVGDGTPCDRRSKRTSYDRIVAQCRLGGRDIAATAVRLGAAKDWPRYSGGFYAKDR